jgi:hypothetical protein
VKVLLRSLSCGLIIVVVLAVRAAGQTLSDQDKQILALARARYYSLAGHGFQSVTCSVSFDFPTVPAVGPDQGRALAESAHFTLKFDGKGPTVEHTFPAGTDAAGEQQAAPLVGVLTALVEGVFQTWPTKGFQGPIPPFDSEIESVSPTAAGYELVLRVPGGPVKMEMDKSYLVKEIISNGGKIDEHPVYTPTPDGLVYSANTARDELDQGEVSNISYELGNAEDDGLLLPTSVRIRVNQNIDTRFSLTGCKVERATVIQVSPATSKPH